MTIATRIVIGLGITVVVCLALAVRWIFNPKNDEKGDW